MKLIRITILVLIGFIPTYSLSQPTYIVGVEDLSYYPLYINSKGHYKGFARDLFDAFAEEQGIKFVYRAMSPKDLFHALLNKEIDFKFPDNPLWQKDLKKEQEVFYSTGVLSFTDGALVLWPKESISVDDIKTLGTIKAFTPVGYLDSIKNNTITLAEYPSLDELVKAIMHGDVDAGYFNILMAKHFVANISLTTLLDVKNKMDIQLDRPIIEFHPDLPHISGEYFLSTTKHPQLIKNLNAFLKSKTQFIQSLNQKYQTESSTTN